ncbi:MAG: hypothetical protein E7324_07580 [Clostridiales bacterium]|nr:hypothetical protein [Clostridiales bacterium]
MHKWMLRGMPVIWLFSLGKHAGGGAAGMGLWALAGFLFLPRGIYPYPRKRNMKPERLFFALSTGWLFLAFSGLFSPAGLLPGAFFHLGSACISAVICANACRWPPAERTAAFLRNAALLLALLFTVYRQ